MNSNPKKTFFKTTYAKYTNFGLQKFRIDFDGQRNLRLNESSKFMFMISLYFITSPILFILSPLVMVLIPFAILQSQGQPITWSNYKTKLFDIVKKHSLIQLCIGFSGASAKERAMLLASASIFLIQTYCNGYAVYKFYTNIV